MKNKVRKVTKKASRAVGKKVGSGFRAIRNKFSGTAGSRMPKATTPSPRSMYDRVPPPPPRTPGAYVKPPLRPAGPTGQGSYGSLPARPSNGAYGSLPMRPAAGNYQALPATPSTGGARNQYDSPTSRFRSYDVIPPRGGPYDRVPSQQRNVYDQISRPLGTLSRTGAAGPGATASFRTMSSGSAYGSLRAMSSRSDPGSTGGRSISTDRSRPIYDRVPSQRSLAGSSKEVAAKRLSAAPNTGGKGSIYGKAPNAQSSKGGPIQIKYPQGKDKVFGRIPNLQ